MLKLQARTAITPDFVAGRAFPVVAPALKIGEEPRHGLIRIQADAWATHTRADIEATLQLQLPLAESFTANGDVRLAWSGPNEWLAFCSIQDEASIVHSLRERFAEKFATVTLISDSRVGFSVAGPDAASFICKGCAIDVEADYFSSGTAVTTRFAGLPAMLVCREVSDYVLYFDVSMTGFVLDWLLDAVEEFRS